MQQELRQAFNKHAEVATLVHKMNPTIHLDTLGVIFKCLNTHELNVCAEVCRMWKTAARDERRSRTRQLVGQAMRWVNANPGHLVLAGSMALWIAENEPSAWFPNDADLFSYGTPPPPSDAPEIAGMHLAERHIACDDCSYSYLCTAKDANAERSHSGPRPRIVNHNTPHGSLQFILSSYFPTAASVVESFDLSCVMVGFVAPRTVVKAPLFSAAEFTAFYWNEPPCTKEDRLLTTFQHSRTAHRAKKYIARGYTHTADKPAAETQMRFARMYSMTNCETLRSMLETGYPVECSCETTANKKKCHFTGLFFK